jgi:cell division protein ZipA
MPELRWILLVFGALLVAGLWWWESKRSRASRQAPPQTEPDTPSGPVARHEPRFGGYAHEDGTSHELPAMRADDRPIPRGDPPVVTIDDLPEDTDRVVLADSPEPARLEPITARRDAPGAVTPEKISIGAHGATPTLDVQVSASREEGGGRAPAPRREAVRVPPREPPVVTASVQPGEVAGAASGHGSGSAPDPSSSPSDGAGAAPEPRRPAARPAPSRPAAPAAAPTEPPAAPSKPAAAGAPVEPAATLQKIVALRLVAAGGEYIDGALLRAALEAEGMRFGKYSIFHRQRADGRAIYSVASLVEPGSFDLDRMQEELYPGVSMFAVFPGPLGAPDTFDEMLASVRRLAERLGIVPQDERGAPLGAQRALQIREELVHFQGLVDKTRSRQNG